ncbi:MAG: CDP-diacylglycerol--glycerol-3-phosphate 3-phosphatidyltransferase [Sphingomonadales bacterium]|nr:CDP-diacylglycerol--glycerol-3-phosphate 3-phosphatidyltransferase [Sphingomonadales bacterium]
MKQLPNLLTLSRILVIPGIIAVFYWDHPQTNWMAFGLFAVAGFNDFFDGYLARSMGVVSKLGQFLDPVADKLMVAATITMLLAFDRVSGIDVIAMVIILCREILVSGLREFLAGLSVSVPVTQLAKWKTTLQMVALGALLIGDSAPAWLPANEVGFVSLWLAAILTLITGYDYLRAGLKHMD